MTISELIILLGEIDEQYGDIQVTIDGNSITSTGIMMGEQGWPTVFDIVGR